MTSKVFSVVTFLGIMFGAVICITVLAGSSSSDTSISTDGTVVAATSSDPVPTIPPTTIVSSTSTILTNPKPVVTTPPPAVSYSMSEVAIHSHSSSCWTAINGNVYDVTAWIYQHPGGAQAILSLCGTDGSVAFNDQHGGQRRPEAELASFKIGILRK